MKELIAWFVAHPIWTFIGSVLGIIGIGVTVFNWVYKPLDAETKALEVPLKDVASEAYRLADLASMSEVKIESMLGKREGWKSSVIKSIGYTQSASSSLANTQAYSKISDHGRKLYTVSNLKLEHYKSNEQLPFRVPALRQHACGLVINSVREIAIIHNKSDIESCFPIIGSCKDEILFYGNSIGVKTDVCKA